ncbi:MAG: hypothetical protein ACPGUV_05220 [Polyangiales bacterium]
MAGRTSLIFDQQTEQAVRELKQRLHCSMAEVVRRALHAYHHQVMRDAHGRVSQQQALLQKLYTSFRNHDPAAEVARLKDEDAYF